MKSKKTEKVAMARCLECGTVWKEAYAWHGQSEICKECVDERSLRDDCKRHSGRDGLDCYFCSLEKSFNGICVTDG